jgi:predicted nucleic acid-binding protein
LILPESSIWIDHLREPVAHLSQLLEQGLVLGHPAVTGEVALGSIANRARVVDRLESLPQLPVAQPEFVAAMIEALSLWGKGVGYVDVHLLASLRIAGFGKLWTGDRRLHEQAQRFEIAYVPD